MAEVATRTAAFEFGGTKRDLVGPELKVGEKAPGFRLLDTSLQTVTDDDLAGLVRIIATVPSLDTGVCDREARRFNQDALALHDDVQVLVVSMDTPFAQKRWCQASESNRIRTLSDRTGDFARAYGVLLQEYGLLARAVFVVDRDGVLRHVEYLPAAGMEPNYDLALAAAKEALEG
ncbi:MAG: thiol peroxidase [Dactylosporangium sp.]|nr:thiol peroxidase [Dactylosporangium sp.]